jgi:DNA invertase Pin-like site-specific DNA recombinase
MRAISYDRWSTPAQSAGHSHERQLENAKKYCEENPDLGLEFNESLSISDKGVSAYRGKNLQRGLGDFLAGVKAGEIPTPVGLIVEDTDRLSRQGIDAAMDLIRELNKLNVSVFITRLGHFGIIKAGAKREQVYVLASQMLISLQAFLGKDESDKKSQRILAAMEKNRREVKKGERLWRTFGKDDNRAPKWLEVKYDKNGKPKIVEIKDRADALRRMFKLHIQGLGSGKIARQLKAEGVDWITTQWVSHHLKDRSVIGEFWSNKGELLCKDYYPKTVSLLDFNMSRQACAKKTKKNEHGKIVYAAGRKGNTPYNLFVSLLHDVSEGEPKPMYLCTSRHSKRNCRKHVNPYFFKARDSYSYLLSENPIDRKRQNSIQYEPFEDALLDFLTDENWEPVVKVVETEDLKTKQAELEKVQIEKIELKEDRDRQDKALWGEADNAALHAGNKRIGQMDEELARLTTRQEKLELEITELRQAAVAKNRKNLAERRKQNTPEDRILMRDEIHRMIDHIDVLFTGDPKLWYGICAQCGKRFTSPRDIALFCSNACYQRERLARMKHGVQKPPYAAESNGGHLKPDRKALLNIVYRHKNIRLPRQIEISGDDYTLVADSDDKEGRRAIKENKARHR